MTINGVERKNVLMNITHKDDLDGLGCNIIAGFYSIALGLDLATMELGYKDVNEKICEFINSGDYKNYSYIAITDLGINPETAELIDEAQKEFPEIKWELLDHHTTNEYLNKYDWAHVSESDSEGELRSATKLAYQEWAYIINEKCDVSNILIPFTNNISDYDTYIWQNKGNQDAKDMHDLMCLIGREDFRKRLVSNLLESIKKDSLILFNKEEKLVIEINKKKIKNYIERKMKYLHFETITLLDGRDMNVALTIIDEKEYCSELGNYICKTIPDKADIAIMICPATQDASMRCTRNDINLGEDIAKLLGGGGHKKAAGFPIVGIRDYIYYGITDEMKRVGISILDTVKDNL